VHSVLTPTAHGHPAEWSSRLTYIVHVLSLRLNSSGRSSLWYRFSCSCASPHVLGSKLFDFLRAYLHRASPPHARPQQDATQDATHNMDGGERDAWV